MTQAGKSGRRPASAGTPGRQEIWQAIRKKSDAFTVEDVVAATGANPKTIRDYLGCLVAGSYVSHAAAEARGQFSTYQMLRDTGHHAPRLRKDGSAVVQGQSTEQLWRSMCILKTFTYRDLIETATVEIPEGTAKSYCSMLLATGYLRVLKKADPAKGQIASYSLIRNTGPKPPQVQRVKRIYDPNTREVYMPEGRE
ncbi:hypothetical protein [Salipiger abyssi]|uniref:Phage protein n=1 Tax=Salipiger abyssi TaxID=1250539 RepID=A0A1P8UXP4_9RHOB|nr:hypothetical protein [Salipiger abyssi]ALF02132.1 hypothetical protein vBPeaSP1_041 [Pelagibaca phage vB_PeaS-P1]APZ54147.1 Phage protein [Salipiger abyssi]